MCERFERPPLRSVTCDSERETRNTIFKQRGSSDQIFESLLGHESSRRTHDNIFTVGDRSTFSLCRHSESLEGDGVGNHFDPISGIAIGLAA